MGNMAKVHFTRPPKIRELEAALRQGIVLHMPHSCFKRLSAKARRLLDSSGAEVVIEQARGRPISLPMEKILQVAELHRDERTFREIEQITGIPKSTCHYLLKYAERQKLTSNGKIVYL